MNLQELKNEADKLSVSDRLNFIAERSCDRSAMNSEQGIEYREVEGIPILTPRQLLDTLDEDTETSP